MGYKTLGLTRPAALAPLALVKRSSQPHQPTPARGNKKRVGACPIALSSFLKNPLGQYVLPNHAVVHSAKNQYQKYSLLPAPCARAQLFRKGFGWQQFEPECWEQN